MNLIEGLLKELQRNRELLELYKSISRGKFGADIIEQKIKKAEKAIASGDVLKELRCYNELKKSK